MRGLNLDLVAGQASAKSIKGVVDEMHRVITQVQKSAISGQAGWDGKASNAFGTTHTDWHGIATRLQMALDEIEVKLTVGFRGYEDDDVTVAGQISSSGGGAPAPLSI
ncbi:WXG100 family type VII secretion target [Gordonia shandongensis]|uniref:WXG100 family type VII secretion target n=1 Tax=Gordonia shandongensis TaxID=376351 RepID=UPI0003F84337|nr:WXG100 family type VII secretion target [Gordonia shandongensis]